MNSTLIKQSLDKSFTYQEYRSKIKEAIHKASENNKNQDPLLEYTILNDKRMDRLDKTLKTSEETKSALEAIKNTITFLVISEGWCGDAAQIVPVLNKIAEASSKIKLKIVFRDENEELMNLFLTNGSKSIPKIIMLNAENKVTNSWGPRPSIATKMVEDYKEQNGSLDADFKKNLQVWYNKDKGINTQEDLIKLLKAS